MAGLARVRQDGWMTPPVKNSYTWLDVQHDLRDIEGNLIRFPGGTALWLPDHAWVTAHTFDSQGTGRYVLEADDTVFTCPSVYLEYEGEK